MKPSDTDQSIGSLLVLGMALPELAENRAALVTGLFDRLLLVDPLAEAPPEALANKLTDNAQIKILSGIASQEGVEVTMTCYNVPGLHSLSPATDALRELFPNIRVYDKISVAPVTAETLQSLVGDTNGPLTIWIDMPGSEKSVLEQLDAIGLLARAEALVLRCGVDPFFEGATTSDALQSWLETRHFSLENIDQDDPDWPDLTFKGDPIGRRISQLEQEVAARGQKLFGLEKQFEAQSATLKARSAQVTALQEKLETQTKAQKAQAEKLQRRDAALAQRDAQIADLRGQLTTQTKARDDQAEQVKQKDAALAQRDAQIADLRGQLTTQTKARDDQAEEIKQKDAALAQRDAQIAEMKTVIGARDASLAEHASALEQSGARIAELERTLTEQTQFLERRESEFSETQNEIESLRVEVANRDHELARQNEALSKLTATGAELEKRVSELHKDVETAQAAERAARDTTENLQSDLAFQMRLQAMQKLDLDDVRMRLQQVELRKQQLEELLRKLTPRLAQAAAQLRQLAPTDSSAALLELAEAKPSKQKDGAKVTRFAKKAKKARRDE